MPNKLDDKRLKAIYRSLNTMMQAHLLLKETKEILTSVGYIKDKQEYIKRKKELDRLIDEVSDFGIGLLKISEHLLKKNDMSK